MALREDVSNVFGSRIAEEAAKDRDDKGCGSFIAYHLDGPGGSFSGYTVTTTIGDLEVTFPRVDATEPPDSDEIHLTHAIAPLAEIRRMRTERKARG